MTNTKNIIFDLGGVLIDIDKESCLRAFQKVSSVNVDKLLVTDGEPTFFTEFEKGNLSNEKFYDAIRERINAPFLSDSLIEELWLSFLKTIAPEKLELLLELKQRYNVFLLSNTNPIHWKEISSRYFVTSKHKLSDYFNSVYLSYQMNLLKPDYKIFNAVISNAQIEPSDSLFIDDSSENCIAAEAVGLPAFLSKDGKDWMNLF